MRQFNVTGMSCAACQARVEKAVMAVPGVESCGVNLLTNSMAVEGSAANAAIIKAVEDAGYGASLKDSRIKDNLEKEVSSEINSLKKRLFISLGFLVVLMCFHEGILQLVLSGIILVINRKFFISGFKSVIHGGPNMDTLVAMGSGVSYLWSVYSLCIGEKTLFFDSAAMILVLITVGKLLEAKSKGKTTDALKALINMAPKTANVIRNGEELTILAEEVLVGDIFVVRSGERIPVDGKVLEGTSAVNESALTGESIPVDKAPGDDVFAATINNAGFIRCEAVKVGEDTTLSGIIRLVREATSTKAPIAKIADRVSGIFVPVVIGIALITFIIWMALGENTAFALARAISVLVISCPCALGLATPVAIMVGNGVGAKKGVLFKNATALEEAGRINIAVFDKTGTITKGTPEVLEVFSLDEDERSLLETALSLEIKSEHPIANAVVSFANEKGIEPVEISGFEVLPGNGLAAVKDGIEVFGGSVEFVLGRLKDISEEKVNAVTEYARKLAEKGMTPVVFAKEKEAGAAAFAVGGKILGILGVADEIKPDSAKAVKELINMGIMPVMLTGDNSLTAEYIAKKAGISQVIAQVMPDEKQAKIKELKSKGRVAMIGDGINDAPALTEADIGIAIGAGTEIAIDAAQIVIMNNTLTDVPAAIRLSKATLRNIKQNMFWAFIYNILLIPFAAGAYAGVLGFQLNPMIGAAAMSLSSLFVVTNALRLNRFKMNADSDIIVKKSEVETMTKTMTIEGMMCAHCEAHAVKALEAIDGVEKAVASHEAKNAVVTLSKDVEDAALKAAVEGEGYKVLDIR